MTDFTPFSALIGGFLIGLSALILFLGDGRIAGISGILGNLLAPRANETAWRAAFLAGLIIAPALYAAAGGHLPPLNVTVSVPLLIAGGFLVGFGTRLGSGCTSGHGVCGMARLSPRSIAATLTFMATGAITVFIMRHLIG
jgi:uncharacterized membrane protein YedE/YeeE